MHIFPMRLHRADPADKPAAAMIAPFAHRNFAWLWGGSLASYATQWLQMASLGWVVYEITGSGTLVGAVMGVRGIPIALLAPFAGVAADRWGRRSLLQLCQWLCALVSFGFGALLALNAVGTWTLFIFSFLMGASVVLDRPARQSAMFELVPRVLAVKAVALNVMGNNLMRVIAPAACGFLIAWVGNAGNFALQGLLCAAAALLVLRVDFPQRHAHEHSLSAWKELRAGLTFAVRDPAIRALFLIGTTAFLFLVPAMGTLFPMYAKDTFQAGPQAVGMMYAAVGVGGVAGGYIGGALSRVDRQGMVQLVANFGFVAMMLGLAASPTLPVALVFCALAGASEMVMTTSNMAMMQMCAPESMRGRITSLVQFYPAMISAGAFATGPLSDAFGPGGATALAAAACGAGTLALYVFSGPLRRLRISEHS